MEIGGDSIITKSQVANNDGEQTSNLNISDVFEAISIADPSFGCAGSVADVVADEDAMYRQQDQRPYIHIVEQPASKALRFRYECEGRSAGSIPGVNSSPERKSYPSIEICGHKGRAVVVVSCVTKDEPYMAHPHNLVGRDLCKKGVCTVHVNSDSNVVTFSNLGIQCVKRKDIAGALTVREDMRVDPFKKGFGHKNNPQNIDLNAVRLCFQAFLQDDRTGKIRQALTPVVSDVIYDKKAMSELLIMRLSQCSGPVKGGTEHILLCEKVTREDTAVVFFERDDKQVVWEECANIVLVHKQAAIVFNAPAYRGPSGSGNKIHVYIQLKRFSDNATSPALPYEYIPDYQDSDYLKNKRRKMVSSLLETYDHDRNFQSEQKPIKAEPRDKTPPHQVSSPPLGAYGAISPQYVEQDTRHDPHYQQWPMSLDATMQPGVSVLGPSPRPFGQDIHWPGPTYGQPINIPAISPNMQAMSPNMQALSPNMQAMSPNMQAMSPNMQAMSPNMQAMSPNMQAMSPNMKAMSPNMQMTNLQAMSPIHGAISPNMGHVSPLGHASTTGPGLQQPQLTQLQQQDNMMETASSDNPSISGLLLDRGDGIPQLNSSELSGLSSLLGVSDRPPDLSDSLTRLSTADLLHHTDLH